VGQSESAVDDLVDVFALLVQPGAGDELQGIKRGVTELADLIVVTKADGDMAALARRAEADYRAALGLLRAKHHAVERQVVVVSAVERRAIDVLWDVVEAQHDGMIANGELEARRARQATAWMRSEVIERVEAGFRQDDAVRKVWRRIEPLVAAGRMSPSKGAADVLAAYHRPREVSPSASNGTALGGGCG
jgi:LAO/AO transport system kinase